jgi:hypothetical protein
MTTLLLWGGSPMGAVSIAATIFPSTPRSTGESRNILTEPRDSRRAWKASPSMPAVLRGMSSAFFPSRGKIEMAPLGQTAMHWLHW